MVTIYVKQNEPQLSQEIIAKIYELRKQGQSFRAIGRELGIPHETVHRYLDSEYREKVCNQHRLKRQEGARKAFLTRVENQRKTLTGYEIGYLEAMIDGEGYLGLLPSRGNGKLRWNIRLSIGNTCKELTEKVRSIVGKGAITYNSHAGEILKVGLIWQALRFCVGFYHN